MGKANHTSVISVAIEPCWDIRLTDWTIRLGQTIAEWEVLCLRKIPGLIFVSISRLAWESPLSATLESCWGVSIDNSKSTGPYSEKGSFIQQAEFLLAGKGGAQSSYMLAKVDNNNIIISTLSTLSQQRALCGQQTYPI